MTNQEAERFVDSVLKGLWPRWETTEEETTGWVQRLQKYDYGRARQAVNNTFFASSSKRPRPPAGKIFKVLKSKARIILPREATEPVLLFSIIKERFFKEDKTSTRFAKGFFATTPEEACDKNEIERKAEAIREKCNWMYGENHIILYPDKKEKSDNGLRGEAAQRQAEQNILAGPDTPGRRFSIKLRADQERRKP